MRTHYKEKFNELFSQTKKDFEEKADLNLDQSRIDNKITSFNKDYKSLVPFAGFSPSGGTRRRKRKTRKGRRGEKRKLTKRR